MFKKIGRFASLLYGRIFGLRNRSQHYIPGFNQPRSDKDELLSEASFLIGLYGTVETDNMDYYRQARAWLRKYEGLKR